MTRWLIVPVTKTLARQFITEHHRHNEAPSPMQVAFAVGLQVDGGLVAVATAGRPVARHLDDGLTLEINRTCIGGDLPNGNSALYGAICRAAKALGYRRVVTYTLQSEPGTSLRAAGFTGPIEPAPRPAGSSSRTWVRPNGRPRYDTTLWGDRKNAALVAKYRWDRLLDLGCNDPEHPGGAWCKNTTGLDRCHDPAIARSYSNVAVPDRSQRNAMRAVIG